MKKNFWIIILIITLLIGFAFSACTDEEDYSSSKSLSLQFSSDTITFDTIFTTIGSVTKQIRVYNPENKAIKLDYITLGSGNNSYYRLNVDGDTSLVAKNVTIGAKDSIFIFVRVELDPNNLSNPLLVEDSIIFSFNGKQQSVLLMAYGQDAYYHLPKHTLGNDNNGTQYSLANEGGDTAGIQTNGNNINWKNDKPHIIVGTCVVDSAFTLHITDGTKIYMANNADFWVYKDGSLKVNGSTSNPVVFQSIRSQDRYSSIPGQWGKIYFIAGSKDNELNDVLIKNANIGVLVDTCVNENPTLTIKNTRIENCSQVGIYARGATIYGENVIVQNTGSYSVALTLGGSYEFIGSTFANYWTYDNTRTKSVLLLNDWYEAADGSKQLRRIEKASFHNTIIYGSLLDNEIEFDLTEGLQSQYLFDHCLLKSNALSNNNGTVQACVLNKDPMFTDVSSNDLHLENSSPAIGSGNGVYNSIVPYDIFGTFRLDPPSIGAIENRSSVEKRR